MRRTRIAGLGAAAAAVVAAAPAGAAGPRVELLVVSPHGVGRQAAVTAARTTVAVGGRRCAVPAGSALAALVASRVGSLTLRDYGSCSARAQDAAGLFVVAVGADRNRGRDGWVYKVGARLATAGAADPAGPFGNGAIRSGSRVTWFYCRTNARTGSCQRTLTVAAGAIGGGRVSAVISAFDDAGRRIPAAGAEIRAGRLRARADAGGRATLRVGAGHHFVYADGAGAVRSFDVAVDVR